MIYLILSVFLFIYSQLDMSGSVVCAFFWILPLIIQSKQKKLSFWQGFVWGLLVFGFHLSWLLTMFCVQDVLCKGLIIWMITVLWFAISSGVWFFLVRYSWIYATLLFFLFLTRLSLFPCGLLEGYPLINPLLPFISCCSAKKHEINEMVFLQPWWYGSKNPMFVGYRMVDSIAACVTEYPHVNIMVMPESTFCFDLHEYEKFISIWSDGFDGGTILLGAHRKSGDGFLNSVFALRDGKIIQVYDKQHLMPFVERIPYCFHILGLGNLFLKNNEQACAQQGEDLFILEENPYQVFVCSELFFQTKQVKGCPIIFLWNDSWLQFEWTKKLALKFIYYFSCKHSVAVIHASTQGKTNLKSVKNRCK